MAAPSGAANVLTAALINVASGLTVCFWRAKNMSTTLSSLLLTAKNIIRKVAPYVPPICAIISNVSGNTTHRDGSDTSPSENTATNQNTPTITSLSLELKRVSEELRELQGKAADAATSVTPTLQSGAKDTSSLDSLPAKAQLTQRAT